MAILTHLILCLMVESARSQFTSSRRVLKTPCETHAAALVEQFFNVIFTEFQNSLPLCTCVQMCAAQPTYCYPNGCLKTQKKQESLPVSSIKHDTKMVFLVDNNAEDLDDFMENRNLINPAYTGTVDSSNLLPWFSSMGHSNPFKEIALKYKKLPKLQMRYNLREQIKHANDKKAEVDLSKTRWPTNKQINREKLHQRTSNYLTSMFPEANQQETSKYFKKYLTKRENQIGLDISTLYLYKDALNFSLENLIDNLIERGLEGDNSTSTFKISISNKTKGEENNGDVKLINSVLEDLQNATDEIAIKNSLEAYRNNNDKQENGNVTNTSTAAYFELITTLSNQIEKQNNLSVKVIGNMASSFNDITHPESNISYNNETTDRVKAVLKVSEGIIESEPSKAPASLHFIPVINSQVKKSQQRIVRKLRNRKLN